MEINTAAIDSKVNTILNTVHGMLRKDTVWSVYDDVVLITNNHLIINKGNPYAFMEVIVSNSYIKIMTTRGNSFNKTLERLPLSSSCEEELLNGYMRNILNRILYATELQRLNKELS